MCVASKLKTNNNMKENLFTGTRGLYEAPDCTSVKIKTDGMLCQSLDYCNINDWSYDEEEL